MIVPLVHYDAARAVIAEGGIALSDLHVHTNASDGLTPPAEAVARARGLGLRIAIADHNVPYGAFEAWEAAGREGFERVVPAIEVTTYERVHMLAYFRLPEDLEAFFEEVLRPCQRRHAHPTTPFDISVGDMLREAARWDGMTSAAHPFAVVRNGIMSVRQRHASIREDLAYLSAIEVRNGADSDASNRRAMRLATTFNKAVTAGSDAHLSAEIGAVMVATPAGEDLFLSLRRRHVVVIDRSRSALKQLIGHSAKLPFHLSRPVRRLRSMAREMNGEAPPEPPRVSVRKGKRSWRERRTKR